MYGLIKTTEAGWLVGKPAYESKDGRYYIAQDYDDLESESQKLMWYVHDDDGFIAAFETLKEAAKSVQGN